jgi:glycosyltransferase involved in cell wall biosynthesis
MEAAAARCKILSTRVGIASDLLESSSLFSDISQAIHSMSEDIDCNLLAGNVDAHYGRILANHRLETVAPAVSALFDKLEDCEVFQGLAAKCVDQHPRTDSVSTQARLWRFAQRVISRRFPRFREERGAQPTRYAGLTVSLCRDFFKPPYGGGNQFMLALRGELQRRGIRVLNNDVAEGVDGYILDSLWFPARLLDKLSRLVSPKVVHRIDGPIYLYRGKDKELDDQIFEINREFATTTIVQSFFSLQRILEAGYRPVLPVVVHNASDPNVFNPTGKAPFDRDRKLRIVSSSWSSNRTKGADVYEWLDKHLNWERYDYLFVGHCSPSFRSIRKTDAVPSAELADRLRASDIYLTASRNDPCSNALVEALSCGLPAIFANSGGHPELAGMGGLGFDSPEEIPDLLLQMATYYEAFQRSISVASICEVTEKYLGCLFGE